MNLNTEHFLGALEAVAPCVCRDDARPQLCGVQVKYDAGAVVITATDGYRLAQCRVKAEGELTAPVVVTKHDVKRLMADLKLVLKNAPKPKSYSTVEIGVGTGGLHVASFAPYAPTDEEFPPTHRVIPPPSDEGPGVVIGADARHLAECMAGAAKLAKRLECPAAVRMGPAKARLDPIRIDATYEGVVELVVIIMPMRL